MANTIHYAGNTYAGEVLEHLLSCSCNENDTVKKGLIHFEAGIQMKKTLPHIKLGNFIQDNVATPRSASGNALSADSKGQYTISERYLEPQDFMLYMEFNPRDYEQYWKPFQPDGELLFRELDPAVQAKMLELIMQANQEYIGTALWMSVKGGKSSNFTAPTGCPELGDDLMDEDGVSNPIKYYNGAMARILINLAAQAKAAASRSDDEKNEVASGSVVLAGSTTLTTGQQVETALRTMWRKIPKRLRNKGGFKFVMGVELWDIYSNYLTDQHHKYTDNTVDNVQRFKSHDIVVIDGIPEHTIVFGRFTTGIDSCLWAGVDYATDQTSVKVEKLQANSSLWFVQMRMKMDVNIVRPSEIVVWTAYGNAAAATP